MFLRQFARLIRRGDSTTPAPVDRSYRAFISYSHADEAWAKWLHVALERYRVPKPLVGRTTAKGVVARRLLPIFRDRDELPGASSLADEIEGALARSQSLIVICSPKAAVSRYVHHEIVTFKRQRREGDVFCLLVDGEPNATDTPEDGLLEALPSAIRYRVSADGAVTDQRAEPLAADVRPGKDRRTDAKLKIVAGMLGVGLDELKRRESRRRSQRRLHCGSQSHGSGRYRRRLVRRGVHTAHRGTASSPAKKSSLLARLTKVGL